MSVVTVCCTNSDMSHFDAVVHLLLMIRPKEGPTTLRLIPNFLLGDKSRVKHFHNSKITPVYLILPETIEPISFSLTKFAIIKMGLFPHVRVSEEWIVRPSRGSRRKLSGHWGGDNAQHAKALPGERHRQVLHGFLSCLAARRLGEALFTQPNFRVGLRVNNQIVVGLSYKTAEETSTEAHNRRKRRCCLKPFVL